MKIGILGGTFNPPHIGHIVLAQEVLEKLKLDKIFFIPTNIPPHKTRDDMEAMHRFNMVKLAIEGKPRFEVKDLELKRGGVSYTIDTIRVLKQMHPQDELFLIVGSDLAQTINGWKEFGDLKKSVKIVVAQRKETPFKASGDFTVVDITQISISSSQIRDRFKAGALIKNFVKDSVADYIEKHNLYK
ncbi:MAG: nicotinate (nicotinamide) nucleotide adenylyltransferase [Candidatus Omnitrophota bacterium]|nr:MAG: nicotinate (nicotinamide) nucleotide adenylyltransferase [Candidatus Omnitrophota bacterium]